MLRLHLVFNIVHFVKTLTANMDFSMSCAKFIFANVLVFRLFRCLGFLLASLSKVIVVGQSSPPNNKIKLWAHVMTGGCNLICTWYFLLLD